MLHCTACLPQEGGKKKVTGRRKKLQRKVKAGSFGEPGCCACSCCSGGGGRRRYCCCTHQLAAVGSPPGSVWPSAEARQLMLHAGAGTSCHPG